LELDYSLELDAWNLELWKTPRLGATGENKDSVQMRPAPTAVARRNVKDF
jgi:hypothetical protein